MSLLTVLTFPNKKLRDKSKPVTKVSAAIQKLAKDMLETMYAKHGIGLAAPQVGELIRLIILDVPIPDPLDPENPEKMKRDALALINPNVHDGSGQIQYEEGCLSCPELIVTVDRFETIMVDYLDLDGRPSKLKATGLKAVCIQHEIDHLNGILLVDKISRLERDMYKKKRVRLAKSEKELAKIL